MKLPFSLQKIQKVMAVSLAVWLSGVAFLFCCGAAMQVQATEADEFCPLAAKKSSSSESHCSKAKSETTDDDNSPTFSKTDVQNLNCCAFLPALFDKARKIEKIEKAMQLAAKAETEAEMRFVPAKIAFEKARIYRPPPLAAFNEKIFIKNCVFRI